MDMARDLHQQDEPKTMDLRVRRTLQLLQKALMELMAAKSFQSITVQDIAERAMVNRATFYDHFVDKYALLEYAIREWFKETLHGRVPAEFTFSTQNMQLLVLTTCEFLSQLRNHCLPRDKDLLPMVQTQITKLIEGLVVKWITEARPDEANMQTSQLAATIASWAIYGAALYWSQADQHEPAHEFVRRAMPMIMAGLSPVVDRVAT
jgi:AcrR family transcriptional regulator